MRAGHIYKHAMPLPLHTSFSSFMRARRVSESYGSSIVPLGEWGSLPQHSANVGWSYTGHEQGRAYFNGVNMGATGDGRLTPSARAELAQRAANSALRSSGDRRTVEHKVGDVRVMRMLPSPVGVGLDVHLSFAVDGESVWGVFQRYGSEPDPAFLCEDLYLRIPDTVAQKKIVGGLRRVLQAWFTPAQGVYKAVAESVPVIGLNGQKTTLARGARVEVVQALPDRLTCRLRTTDGEVHLTGTNYLWFNYWFTRAGK
jgi:hypothetical protein